MTITSPHNEQLKEIRKLAGRKWRDKLRLFVAEGEDLVDAADAAGWGPRPCYVAAGTGLEGVQVAPHVLAERLPAGLGHARARRLRPALGAGARSGPLCVALWGVNDPGNVGTVLRSALAFGAGSVALGPGQRRPVRPEGGARLDGRDVRRAGRARARRRPSCPGAAIALVARAAATPLAS